MAKISALTELARADVLGTDYLVVVDASATTTKRINIDSLLGALDGDQLDIDFTPTNYTPDAATPAEAADVDDLTAHLQGIDTKLAEVNVVNIQQSDTTFTLSTTVQYVEIDTSGGAVTATLPSAVTQGAGWKYCIKITDATNLTTIATNGAQTIDGSDGWQLSYADELLEIISDGTNWKILRWDLPLQEMKGSFAYVNATSYNISASCYRLPTCNFKKVYFKATLTLGPSTWAAGSTTIATTGWHYLYLDQSAIDAGTSPIITDSHFISSTTAPSFNTTYMAWYNGNDRCVFAVRFDAASTLYKFYHDGGDLVQFDADYVAGSGTSPTTDWAATTITFTRPSFCVKVPVFFECTYNTNISQLITYWRSAGSSGAGHSIGLKTAQGADWITHTNGFADCFTNTSGQISMYATVTDAQNTYNVNQLGFFFPRGF